MTTDGHTLTWFNRRLKPRDKAFILGSLHFLNYEQIAEHLRLSAEEIARYVDLLGGSETVMNKVRENHTAKSLKRWLMGVKKKRRSRMRAVSRVREDLGIFLRSKMEANLARILTLRDGEGSWTYEPEKFEIKVGKKTRHYLPDFHVNGSNGEYYVEVKGRFFTGDKSKLKAFLRDYPDKKLIIYTNARSAPVIDFADKNGVEVLLLEDLKAEYRSRIPEWE